ncbi:hypothetical protein BPO_1589 [Bergeyella porcorum]|uniref:Uncharacterized protein n=1 Tax=Bergeyella porcorum TaxID=1735111 RepID=A0AAU0F4E2_9FLAO
MNPENENRRSCRKKQAKIDSGEEFIIGVNSFKSSLKQPDLRF